MLCSQSVSWQSKGRTPALKKLSERHLGEWSSYATTHTDISIQSGEHSSVDDARATMALYRMFRTEWERSIKNRKLRRLGLPTIKGPRSDKERGADGAGADGGAAMDGDEASEGSGSEDELDPYGVGTAKADDAPAAFGADGPARKKVVTRAKRRRFARKNEKKR